MPVGVLIVVIAIVGLLAIPLSSALPEPFATLSLAVLTVLYPFVTVWLLQEEARRGQNQGS